MEYLIIGLIIWFACGVLNYGISFAYWQREFDLIANQEYYVDRRDCLIVSLGGPISLLVSLLFFGLKHGLKFK